MKKRTTVFLIVLLAVGFGLSKSWPLKSEDDHSSNMNESGSSSLNLPPSSLNSLYPPKAKEPVYLFMMLSLAEKFTGRRLSQEGELKNGDRPILINPKLCSGSGRG